MRRFLLIAFFFFILNSTFCRNFRLFSDSAFVNTQNKLSKVDSLFQIDSTQIDLYIEKANKYYNDNDFERALFFYNKVLECDTSNIVSYYNIGVIYFNYALTCYNGEEPMSLESFHSKIIKADNYLSISKVFFKSVLKYVPDNKEAYEIIKEINRRKNRITIE